MIVADTPDGQAEPATSENVPATLFEDGRVNVSVLAGGTEVEVADGATLAVAVAVAVALGAFVCMATEVGAMFDVEPPPPQAVKIAV